MTHLKELAYARSGDKGNHVNIGVIARQKKNYDLLKKKLTEKKVKAFFKTLGVKKIKRYELDNLHALNFVLYDILDGGGMKSLRIDAQGKAIATALLEMEI